MTKAKTSATARRGKATETIIPATTNTKTKTKGINIKSFLYTIFMTGNSNFNTLTYFKYATYSLTSKILN